jgi:hypothetical protein
LREELEQLMDEDWAALLDRKLVVVVVKIGQNPGL